MGGGGDNEVEETEEEKAAAEVAMARYNRYQEKYVPLENQAFADITGERSATAASRKAGGMVNADSAKALSSASANAPGYVDPSSGAYRAAIDSPDRAKIVANAAGKAAGLGRKQQIKGLQAAVNIGNNQANDTELSFDALARTALDENITNQASEFNKDSASTNAIFSGVGAVAGAAANIKKPGAPMEGMRYDGIRQSGNGFRPNSPDVRR